MAGWSGLGTGLKALVAGGVAAAAVAVTALVWQGRPAPAPPASTGTPGPVAAAPAPDAAPPAIGPAIAPAEPATPAVVEAEPPSFDVVRVEPDGAALVAGRAEAGQDVAVLIDGAQAALAQADPQGRFVVFLTLASSTDARVMTLELRPARGAAVPSSDRVLLAPTPDTGTPPGPVAGTNEPDGTAPDGTAPDRTAPDRTAAGSVVAVAAPPATLPATPAENAAGPDTGETVMAPAEPATPPEPPVATAAAPAAAPPPAVGEAVVPPAAGPVVAQLPSAVSPAPPQIGLAETAPAPGAAPPPPVQPAAPAAILLSVDTVRLLQGPEGTASAPGEISIDAISYTASGAVALSGRGQAQAFVRLYLDNRAVLETGIGEDGAWAGTLPVVAPGVYTLRADQVSAQGQVTSRFETPFQREDPQGLSATGTAATATGAPGAQADPPGRISITVQPGFTLWQIARETYGDGMLFVRVYDANKTLIRDPDLIYPGQVFTVPQAD